MKKTWDGELNSAAQAVDPTVRCNAVPEPAVLGYRMMLGLDADVLFWSVDESLVDEVYDAMDRAFETNDPGILDRDTTRLHRLREGVERFFVTDASALDAWALARASLPVMWDFSHGDVHKRPEFNHVPGGANVLYMDGHVDFHKFPSEFPLIGAWVYRPLAM